VLVLDGWPNKSCWLLAARERNHHSRGRLCHTGMGWDG
jgi:hypothetical protein